MKQWKRIVWFVFLIAACGLLSACGKKTASSVKETELSFDVNTGDYISVSVDEESGYGLTEDDGKFSFVSRDKDTPVDVNGVFLSKTVATNTQIKFMDDDSYQEIDVNGVSGYGFKGVTKDNIECYVHVFPVSDSDTYVELFSETSNEELVLAESLLHFKKVIVG